MKEIDVPLFEGYLFCRLDSQLTARVVTTPGVIRIVGVAGHPAAIDEEEVLALQRIVAAQVGVQPIPFLQVGQRVRIESGSLAGVEGILESLRGNHRIVVSIGLLQRSVAVELHCGDVCVVEERSGGTPWPCATSPS